MRAVLLKRKLTSFQIIILIVLFFTLVLTLIVAYIFNKKDLF